MDWGKGKKAGGNSTDIERITFSFDTPTKIRLVGGVLPRYVYWVSTNEGKRFPVECLRFSREKESFTDAPDPITDKVSKEVYNDKPSFAYVAQCIDRADGKVKLFDLKSTIYNAIIDYAQNEEYGNPADADKGYDLTIKKTKTGPQPMNVQYSVTAGRSISPLTEEEKKLELFELEVLMKRPSFDEVYEWLAKNTGLLGGDYPDEFKSEIENEKSSDLD